MVCPKLTARLSGGICADHVGDPYGPHTMYRPHSRINRTNRRYATWENLGNCTAIGHSNSTPGRNGRVRDMRPTRIQLWARRSAEFGGLSRITPVTLPIVRFGRYSLRGRFVRCIYAVHPVPTEGMNETVRMSKTPHLSCILCSV